MVVVSPAWRVFIWLEPPPSALIASQTPRSSSRSCCWAKAIPLALPWRPSTTTKYAVARSLPKPIMVRGFRPV